jgi:hypothetical protein
MRKFVVLLTGVALAAAFSVDNSSATEVSTAGGQKICGSRWRKDENGNFGCFWSGKTTATSVTCGGTLPGCTVIVFRTGPHGGHPAPSGKSE